ncbi:MAG: phosphoribosylglycinamide formyltransferase [Gemmatimonadales bacterium]
MYRVGVFASGSGTNLQSLIDAAGREFTVCVVATDNPAAGALQRAAAHNIPTISFADPRDGPDIVRSLAKFELDLVVLAGYLKLVPADVVAAFNRGMINIHPALLPAFGGKGMYGIKVHEAVLASGCAVSGPTVHVVGEEYDRGRILAQWPVPVLPADSAAELQRRVLAVEHQLLPAVVKAAAAAGTPVPLEPRTEAFAAADDPSIELRKE